MTTTCKTCKKEISKKAPLCPHCGHPRTSPKMRRLLRSAAFFVLVAISGSTGMHFLIHDEFGIEEGLLHDVVHIWLKIPDEHKAH